MKKNIVFVFIIISALLLILTGIIMLLNFDQKGNGDSIEIEKMEEFEDFIPEDDIVYNTDNMMLIDDYKTFYTLEKIIKEIINNVYNEKYTNVIGSTSKEYFEQNGEEVILKKLKRLNTILNTVEYDYDENSKLLHKVYERKENEYNCLIEIDDIHYILVYLDQENKTYEIRDFVLSEEIK